jgi:hypothetical protein
MVSELADQLEQQGRFSTLMTTRVSGTALVEPDHRRAQWLAGRSTLISRAALRGHDHGGNVFYRNPTLAHSCWHASPSDCQ